MKRREWMMLCGLAAVGCRKEVEAPVTDRSWNEMRGEWEGMGSGQIDTGEPMRLGWGETMTAARWKGTPPAPPFELELMAKRIDGTDFFCAVTFLARGTDDYVTLVIGGWGGGTVGISSIDDKDASENETTTYGKFETDVWYAIRLVRNGERIEAWIDGDKLIDLNTTGKVLALRAGPIEDCAPFGIATWQTTAIIRDVRWRSLD